MMETKKRKKDRRLPDRKEMEELKRDREKVIKSKETVWK